MLAPKKETLHMGLSPTLTLAILVGISTGALVVHYGLNVCDPHHSYIESYPLCEGICRESL